MICISFVAALKRMGMRAHEQSDYGSGLAKWWLAVQDRKSCRYLGYYFLLCSWNDVNGEANLKIMFIIEDRSVDGREVS